MKQNSLESRIKLLVIINDMRIGGAQKIVCDVLNQISDNKFDVHLLTLVEHNNQPDFYSTLPKSVKVHRMNFGSMYKLRGWKEAYQIIRHIKPDVVWSHLFLSNCVSRAMKPLLSYRVVSSEHNTYKDKGSLKRWVDYILSFFTHKIVAVSEQVKNYTIESESINPKKFVVIPNGIDINSFSKNFTAKEVEQALEKVHIGKDKKIVIAVGQLIEQKNHTMLVEAFATFSERYDEYVLLILGEGSKRSEIEQKVKDLGLEDKVYLPGIIKHPAIYYKASDFFVLPSKFEGFAIVCIEAMAAKLPVISTKVAGPSEYIEDSRNGFLVENSAKSFAEKMSEVVALDIVQKEAIKRNASKTAIRYDIERITESYESLFKDALKHR